MYSLPFKPYMHSTVTIGAATMFLTLPDLLCKWQVPCGNVHSLDIVIVTASRNLKEPTHFTNWIFILMTIDHHIFYACSHFLSVSERKSRNNSFSILNRNTSSSKLLIFDGRPFFFGRIPASILRKFLLWRFTKPCTCSDVIPNLSAISFLLHPFSFIRNISASYSFKCVYDLDIQLPPWYGILILPHQGGFCLLSVFYGLVHLSGLCFIKILRAGRPRRAGSLPNQKGAKAPVRKCFRATE